MADSEFLHLAEKIQKEFLREYRRQFQHLKSRLEAMEEVEYRQELAKIHPEAAKAYEQDTLEHRQIQIQEGAMSLAVSWAIVYALEQVGLSSKP